MEMVDLVDLFHPYAGKNLIYIFYIYDAKQTHHPHHPHQFMRLEIIARLARRFEVLKNKPFGLVGFNSLPPVEIIFTSVRGPVTAKGCASVSQVTP